MDHWQHSSSYIWQKIQKVMCFKCNWKQLKATTYALSSKVLRPLMADFKHNGWGRALTLSSEKLILFHLLEIFFAVRGELRSSWGRIGPIRQDLPQDPYVEMANGMRDYCNSLHLSKFASIFHSLASGRLLWLSGCATVRSSASAWPRLHKDNRTSAGLLWSCPKSPLFSNCRARWARWR